MNEKDRAQQLVAAAMWLRLSGDQEGASRLFAQALKLDPQNADARTQLEGARKPEARSPPPKRVESTPGDTLASAAFELQQMDWSQAVTGEAYNPGGGAEDPKGDGVAAVEIEIDPNPHEPDVFHLLEEERPSGDSAPAMTGSSMPVSRRVEALVKRVEDLMALDDHSGAHALLEEGRRLAPSHLRVQALWKKNQETLLAIAEARIGPLSAVPKVVLPHDQVIWLNLDPRAGFVLAQIDGQVSFLDVYALSGMSRLDTAQIINQLLNEGVIQSS